MVEVSDTHAVRRLREADQADTEGLDAASRSWAPQGSPPMQASAVEFVLEGLHLNKRLNKDKVAGRYQYRG